MNNMLPKIEIDNNVSKKILECTEVFKDIHPNLITSFGLLMNYFIYKELNHGKNVSKLIILLVFRWLADCLDGNVARKYKKCSKLGGYLDTISDCLLFLIFGDFIIKQLKLPKEMYTILFTCFILIMTYYDSLHDHSNITVYKKDSINLLEFFVNNTWAYFLIFLFVYFILKRRKTSK